MSGSLELWVPAIGAAVLGAALYGYAAVITRRFDKRAREAEPEQVYLPPVRVAQPAKSGQPVETHQQRQAIKTQSASAAAGSNSPSKS